VYFADRTRGSGLDGAALSLRIEQLLAAVGAADATVSVTIVRDRAMRALNRLHRGKDATTDVLSFPLYPPNAFDRTAVTRLVAGGETERMLGDVVISLDVARRQAADYDAPLDREFERLFIHGILHLCGHDHLVPVERAVMEREERRLADALGMPWPYETTLGTGGAELQGCR
jgi:probable rRNA maturation factor